MQTLTYRNIDDWRPGQISSFIKQQRQWFRRKGFRLRAVWVAELQGRGAVHYHVLCWVPKGAQLPRPDKRGWWPWGFTHVRRCDHGVNYICKYASKGYDGRNRFPKGLRLYGIVGLAVTDRLKLAWHRLPAYIRGQCTPADRVKRASKGGWLFPKTGEVVPAMWRFCGLAPGGKARLIRVRN